MTITDLERIKEIIPSNLFPVEGAGKTNSIAAEDLAKCLFELYGKSYVDKAIKELSDQVNN